MIIKKCKGCGSTLQTEYPDQAGFIPSLDVDSSYCKRCFRMKHYNELPKIVATNADYEHVIDNAINNRALFIFIVDIFAFKATFNKEMIDKLRDKDVILVANKYDVFPHSTKTDAIVNWLSHQCESIKFKVLAIHIVSSKKGHFIDELLNTIDLARRERDVYFIGCANVGKSSLINALLKRNTTQTEDVIATSRIPGTTLNEIRIPFFDDNRAFIDTPGLINTSDALGKLLPISYAKIMPDREIKPLTYQITDGNSIFLGGLASLSFKCNSAISVVIYSANSLYIHRTKTENLDHLYETQIGKLLTPPTLEEVDKLTYKKISYSFDGQKKVNIWFSGFGFVTVIGKTEVTVKTIDETGVYVTNAII